MLRIAPVSLNVVVLEGSLASMKFPQYLCVVCGLEALIGGLDELLSKSERASLHSLEGESKTKVPKRRMRMTMNGKR